MRRGDVATPLAGSEGGLARPVTLNRPCRRNSFNRFTSRSSATMHSRALAWSVDAADWSPQYWQTTWWREGPDSITVSLDTLRKRVRPTPRSLDQISGRRNRNLYLMHTPAVPPGRNLVTRRAGARSGSRHCLSETHARNAGDPRAQLLVLSSSDASHGSLWIPIGGVWTAQPGSALLNNTA